jgi:diguanylate cyclase (GGDEF)-like protein
MKHRILILDDLEEEVQLLTQTLEVANYKVITTNQESELLDLIESEYPDLILISGSLINKDIYLICKKVKLLEQGEDIPVIFIDGKLASLDPEMIFNSGASDYINYPFNSPEILTKISTQIQLKTLKQQLKERTNQLQKLIIYYQKLKVTLEKAQANLDQLLKKNESNNILADEKTFRQTVEKEWLRAARQRAISGDVADNNISLIMAQLNDFESYQNHHEPQLIENCLNLVAESISSLIKRSGDLITDFKGGKFAILLPNTSDVGAQIVAEKIQENLNSLNIPHSYSELSDYLSFSIGIANGIATQGLPPDIFIEKAEDALQRALQTKQNNTIEIDYV